MTTVTPAEIEALRRAKDQERERLHTEPATPYEAWQLVAILVRQDRRVPEDVAGQILLKLGESIFHVCPEPTPCECAEVDG